ncbi:MAG: mechanosensitive ion channel domain-containing protein [Bryobacteraceae bacterium]
MRFAAFIAAVRRLGTVCAVPALAALLLVQGPALRAQRPLEDQDILRYLSQTIAWYRDVAVVAQSSSDARQAIFADRLRQSSAEAVRLAFEFARAQAAIPRARAPEAAPPGDARSHTLAQSAAAAEQRAEQAQAQIERINQQLETSPPRLRPRLLALRNEVTSEANFAKARRDALRNLLGFLSAPGEGGLAAKVNDLERTIPEVGNARQKAASAPTASVQSVAPQGFNPESSGLAGLATEIFSIYREMRRLDRLAEETDALRQAGEGLRGPLRKALREVIRQGDATTQAPESSDVAALKAQQSEIDALLAQFKQLSASTAPLSEQSTQINTTRGRILEWRGMLAENRDSTLRYLLLRAGMLAVALGLIFGLAELWRHATMRYVQDLRRRRQVLLFRRIVVSCAVVLFIVLSFVTEFGSLATFAGFSAAGLAVAMQSVILSMVAYFFLVGRWGVRIGDRVTVSGVTGEVVDIGLFRLYLLELGGSSPTLHPTGRIVVFPNSVFFQSSALFKQAPGIDYAWRAITVQLPAAADSAVVERRLLAAVESVYEEYREVIERQHGTAQSRLSVTTDVPRPESRLRFVDSDQEITIRYPVEIRRAAEIDGRITREVVAQLEKDPKPMFASGGGYKIQVTAG